MAHRGGHWSKGGYVDARKSSEMRQSYARPMAGDIIRAKVPKYGMAGNFGKTEIVTGRVEVGNDRGLVRFRDAKNRVRYTQIINAEIVSGR